MADRASPPPGVRRIGRWTLRRPLGKGGMGQTWLVFEDTPSGHPRMGVMKLLLASNVGDEATQRQMCIRDRHSSLPVPVAPCSTTCSGVAATRSITE